MSEHPHSKRASILALSMGFLFAGSASALTIPDLNTNHMTSVYYLGDFYSMLLPVLAYQANPNQTGPGNPYYVPSSPGQIQDFVVILTGAEGTAVTTNTAGFDNAYTMVNNATAFSTTNFAVSKQIAGYDISNEPTAKVDDAAVQGYGGLSTWDADISALRTYLNGQKALFLFNHNETKKDEYLQAWGQIVLTKAGGADPIFIDLTYNNDLGNILPYVLPDGPGEYTNNGKGFGFISNDPLDPNNDEWVTSPGEYNYPGGPDKNFSLNLGANQAAYMLYSPDLQAILDDKNSGYENFHLVLALKDINNGYEQVFLMGDQMVVVPLPSAGIMGLGLLGILGGYRLIRRSK